MNIFEGVRQTLLCKLGGGAGAKRSHMVEELWSVQAGAIIEMKRLREHKAGADYERILFTRGPKCHQKN